MIRRFLKRLLAEALAEREQAGFLRNQPRDEVGTRRVLTEPRIFTAQHGGFNLFNTAAKDEE